MEIILAIDPGKDKCGIAIVKKDLSVSYKGIISTGNLAKEIIHLIDRYSPSKIILGDATFSRKIKEILTKSTMLEIISIDEKHSTEKARLRYFKDNPPRGIWRIIPLGLQVPKVPFDDYAAIILAEKYLKIENRDSDHFSNK